MKKPAAIQINIPNPCQQAWDDMTPQDGGRFCHSCEKTVIDFTTYTDAQLYAFFSRQKGKVCGRYLASQLNRNINIPPQPHSKLYKWFVALGLTLVFVPVTEVSANLLLYNHIQSITTIDEPQTENNNQPVVKGKVIDENRHPLLAVMVRLLQDGLVKGGAVTDENGNFIITPVPKGTYELKIHHTPYYIVESRTIIVANDTIDLNIQLTQDTTMQLGVIFIENTPTNKTKQSKKKKR